MASELTVQTLKGPTSGANANKIIVPSGHTLAAAGHVVQVVNNADITQITLSATGVLTETGLEATITPTSASSKILIIVNQQIQVNNNGYAQSELRSGATLGSSSLVKVICTVTGYTASTTSEITFDSINYLDAPATTSPIRYFVAATLASGGPLYTNSVAGPVSSTSTITLMEIAQ